jgi:malate synthase
MPGLTLLEPAPRTVRGARDLLSVALQYGNAFGRGFQAAALKPADFLRQRRRALPDGGHGDRRDPLSHPLGVAAQEGAFTDDDPETGVRGATCFTRDLFDRLLEEEYAKLLAARDRDVHDDSKTTTLPIARAIVEAYVRQPTSSRPGTSTCSTSTSTTTTSETRASGSRASSRPSSATERRITRLTDNLDFGHPDT